MTDFRVADPKKKRRCQCCRRAKLGIDKGTKTEWLCADCFMKELLALRGLPSRT